MRKVIFIAVQDYLQNVLKRSFILVLLSVPLYIAFSVGMGFFLESTKDNPLPVGYVDYTGIFPVDGSSRDVRSDWDSDYGEYLRLRKSLYPEIFIEDSLATPDVIQARRDKAKEIIRQILQGEASESKKEQ